MPARCVASPRNVVDPPRPVEILDKGSWYDGWLSMWTRDEYGWRAFVEWQVGPGQNRLGLVNADRVRRLG